MRCSVALQLLSALSVLAAPAPQSSPNNRFSLYTLPTPLSGPCDLEHGPDGALWGQAFLNNIIFRIDPQTGHIDEYPIPFTTPVSATPITLPGLAKAVSDRVVLSCAIRRGADGNLYAGNGLRNQLVRINPTTKKIDIFQITPINPAGDLQPFNDLYSAADGIYVTSTTANAFSFFSFATEKFTPYTIPTPAALPLGLIVASDGRVYLAEFGSNKILIFDPKTKKMSEYPLPELAQFPTVVRAERNGYVYFALFIGNGIGRINMKTYEIDIYHTNQIGSIGAEDTIDKYGGVWYSSFTSNTLARLDTDTFKYSYVSLPFTTSALGLPSPLGSIPPYVDVAINYGPGDAIWFTSLTLNIVGRYNISGLYH